MLTFTLGATLMAPPSVRAQLTSAERGALDDLAPAYAQRFELRRGWFRSRPVLYFDFGPAALSVSPVFLFVTGFDAAGRPAFVPGQHPVVSLLPGLEGYSGIWQVQYVVVRPGYVANTVREARVAVAMALRGEVRLVFPGIHVNYPIVPLGSSLAGDPAHRAPRTGWYKGREVAYFDFDRSPLTPAPIYGFITGETDGAPQFLRAQANVVDAVPLPDTAYFDMWDVHFVTVPAGYTPDTIRDLRTLLAEAAAGRVAVRRVGQTRNCPVVLVDDRPAGRIPLFRPNTPG